MKGRSTNEPQGLRITYGVPEAPEEHLRVHRIQGGYILLVIVVVVEEYRDRGRSEGSIRLLVTVFCGGPIGVHWVTVSLDTAIIG